jgi:DNA-binding GntR family transcriptional regulator
MSRVADVARGENEKRSMRQSGPRLPPLTPVARETVQEKVYGELREALMRGRFAPGAAVTLRGLADALGTSPMPIRAALHQLVAEQALVVRPNRTVIVPRLTAERFNEIRHIRVALEGMMTGEAARKIAPADIERLSKAYEAMDAAVAKEQVPVYLSKNQEFHFTIYRAAQMPSALRLVENLWMQVGPVLNFLLARENARPSLYLSRSDGVFQKYHRAALVALRRRDAAAARQSIADDINEAADFLLTTSHFATPTDEPEGERHAAGLRGRRRQGAAGDKPLAAGR